MNDKEFTTTVRTIFAEELQKYLDNLKEYEKEDTSQYNKGYYDGFQKAINLIKNK